MDKQQQSGFRKWLDASYLSPDMKKAVTTTADCISTATEIVGG
jgi:hypothetical protein